MDDSVLPDNNRNVIGLAHNFKGYDSYFILQQCYKLYLKPGQLAKGAKILPLSFTGLKFLGVVVGKLLEGFDHPRVEQQWIQSRPRTKVVE